MIIYFPEFWECYQVLGDGGKGRDREGVLLVPLANIYLVMFGSIWDLKDLLIFFSMRKLGLQIPEAEFIPILKMASSQCSL